MILKLFILLFVSVVFCQNLSEGDRCFKDGSEGVCIILRNCRTALAEVKQNKRPQICSFDKLDNYAPIVCCVDKAPANRPPSPPPVQNNQNNYNNQNDQNNQNSQKNQNNQDQCEPIPQHMTSPKTGQKAFDKCIDYQQKYVYPCERGTALVGNFERQNNCYHKTDSLIIGGTDADQYEFPHMALLGYGDRLDTIDWDCGGSIVSERFILTAGHCTYRRPDDPVTYIAIGLLRRREAKDPSKIYKVKTIHKHPSYTPNSKYNDIALIETEKMMPLSQFIVPACLHTGDHVDDSRVLASGWGNTQGDGTHKSEILQKVIISKFSAKECAKVYKPYRTMKTGFNDQTQSCYGDREDPQLYQNRFMEEHKDTCKGDSGGPIQIKYKKIHCMYTIVGVTSIGRPKCGHKPAIYTRVAQYLSWIEDTVWPN